MSLSVIPPTDLIKIFPRYNSSKKEGL